MSGEGRPLCKWCEADVAEWGDICEGHRLANLAHSVLRHAPEPSPPPLVTPPEALAAARALFDETARRAEENAAPPCPECGNPAGKGHSASAPCGLRILARSEGNG